MGKPPEVVAALEWLARSGVAGDPRDPKLKTRARLLRTATELFQARGYQHTSVDDIAREAGVAKGTVYVHFKNKQELLFHAIAEEKKTLLAEFAPLFERDYEPAERLRRYIEQSLVSLPRVPLIAKLMSGDRQMLQFLDELGPELREQIQSAQLKATTSLLRGVGNFDRLPAKQRDERVRTLLGVLYNAGQLLDVRVRAGLSLERYAQHLAAMIVHGGGAP